ncbi:hypothetical protein IG631_17649 [Alternaria alternata]|nr:hypothetical protein IG631_17649 [Alternaria alternata]
MHGCRPMMHREFLRRRLVVATTKTRALPETFPSFSLFLCASSPNIGLPLQTPHLVYITPPTSSPLSRSSDYPIVFSILPAGNNSLDTAPRAVA